MAKTVAFRDEIVLQARDAAPTFAFSQFAQAAVREKIDRERLLRGQLRQRIATMPRPGRDA